MEKRVLEAYIPGKRKRGRPRCKWEKTIIDVFGSVEQASRIAEDRNGFSSIAREATL